MVVNLTSSFLGPLPRRLSTLNTSRGVRGKIPRLDMPLQYRDWSSNVSLATGKLRRLLSLASDPTGPAEYITSRRHISGSGCSISPSQPNASVFVKRSRPQPGACPNRSNPAILANGRLCSGWRNLYVICTEQMNAGIVADTLQMSFRCYLAERPCKRARTQASNIICNPSQRQWQSSISHSSGCGQTPISLTCFLGKALRPRQFSPVPNFPTS